MYSLREKGKFYLIAIDADPEKRYQRISMRRSATDNISFATFLENEKREMDSTDPNTQNLSKCIELADFKLWNSGTLEQLNQQVEAVLKEIGGREDSRTVRR